MVRLEVKKWSNTHCTEKPNQTRVRCTVSFTWRLSMFGSSSLRRLAYLHTTQKERHQEVLVTDGMTQFERGTARSAHPQLRRQYQCSGGFLFFFEGQVSRMSDMNASTIKENLLTHQSARSSCPSPTSYRGRRKNKFLQRGRRARHHNCKRHFGRPSFQSGATERHPHFRPTSWSPACGLLV